MSTGVLRVAPVDDAWAMVAAERTELAELGSGLTTEQWDTPSLCAGWTVRHAFTHVVQGARLSVRTFLPSIVMSGFNINRGQLRAAVAEGDARKPEELVAELRLRAESRRRPPGSTTAGVLAEVVVHGQDIRRPLGIDRVPPVERTTLALWSMVRTGSILGNTKRIAGVRLVATDVDWSYGEGPEVRGPAEALLMATCGRRVALAALEGPGVDTLRSR